MFAIVHSKKRKHLLTVLNIDFIHDLAYICGWVHLHWSKVLFSNFGVETPNKKTFVTALVTVPQLSLVTNLFDRAMVLFIT